MLSMVLGAVPAASLLLPDHALAACTPEVANADVVCAADDADGFDLGSDGVNSLTVNSGINVQSGPLDDAAIEIGGNTGTISNNGTVDGILSHGVQVDGTISIVVNNDTILADGNGVEALGIGEINNFGLIESFFDDGVDVDGDVDPNDAAAIVGQLTNHGTIRGFDQAIDVGTLTQLQNNGDILGANGGIEATQIGTLINFGLIDGFFGDGLDVDGDMDPNDVNSAIGLLINHGIIRGDDDGIDVGTLTSLINTGTIEGGFDGFDESGIVAAVITSIVNSGTIKTGGDITNAYAIEERDPPGGDTQLTLNAGSILIGRVNLGAGTNILNIGSGLSLNSTFESDGGASLVSVGTINGHLVAVAPVTINGNNEVQVVAVDQSAFTDMDDALLALTRGLARALQNRRPHAITPIERDSFANRFAAAEQTAPSAFSAFETNDASEPRYAWVETFGSVRSTQGNQTGGDFLGLTGGLLAGVDFINTEYNLVTSAFVGLAADTSDNSADTQTNTSTSYLAGLQASLPVDNLQLAASLTVGYTDYDQDRVTANNQVATGLETANATFGGWFVNPRLALAHQAASPFADMALGSFTGAAQLEQHLALSYAGQFLDGYTGTGTTNPLTLSSRSTHYALVDASLVVPFERSSPDGSLSSLNLLLGLEGHTRLAGDSVDGTLLGQSVSTTLSDDDWALAARTGFRFEHETASGLSTFAGGELSFDTSASLQFSANAGLRITF